MGALGWNYDELMDRTPREFYNAYFGFMENQRNQIRAIEMIVKPSIRMLGFWLVNLGSMGRKKSDWVKEKKLVLFPWEKIDSEYQPPTKSELMDFIKKRLNG